MSSLKDKLLKLFNLEVYCNHNFKVKIHYEHTKRTN